MKNKNGFTLIELLAVIVILGIILSIAYVGLIEVIESTKLNSFKITTGNIYNAASNEIIKEDVVANRFYYINGKNYNENDEKLEFDGEIPNFGVVDITSDGDIAIVTYNGIYCATRAGDKEDVSVIESTIEECKTYNIIKSSKSWTDIALKYGVNLQSLLDLNEEVDVNSSTVGRNIKIPIYMITDDSIFVEGIDSNSIYQSRATTYNYVEGENKLDLSEDDYDEGYGYIDLGFDLKFGGSYGTTYTEIYPTANGYINFAPLNTKYENISATIVENPCVMPYWDDMVFETSTSPNAGIYYTIGSEDGKKYVLVEWREINDYNSDNQDETTVGSFEVKMYENGLIKYYYKDVEFEGTDIKNGLGATIGVYVNENNYNEYSIDSESIANGVAIEYYLSSGILQPQKYVTKENGTMIRFNPETGYTCLTPYSEPGVKTGCLYWYVFNDEPTKDSFDLILDHDTSGGVLWNSTGSNLDGPKEILTTLSNDTATWIGIPNRTDSYSFDNGEANYTIDYSPYKARLITLGEIAKITGYTDFNEETNSEIIQFYFDSNSSTRTSFSKDASEYGWLFEDTANCMSYGCSFEYSTGGDGYWTATAAQADYPNNAWQVTYRGDARIHHRIDESSYGFGLRPVISVKKSIIYPTD